MVGGVVVIQGVGGNGSEAQKRLNEGNGIISSRCEQLASGEGQSIVAKLRSCDICMYARFGAED